MTATNKASHAHLQLLLWRHAEAEDGDDDMARQLTPRGQQQAKSVAGWLKNRLPAPLRVLVSPAVRARQTADALLLPYETSEELRPMASTPEVLETIRQIAAHDRKTRAILIVGHQPTLGRLGSLLLTGTEVDLAIAKSGLWWLSMKIDCEKVQVTLKAVVSPDFLA